VLHSFRLEPYLQTLGKALERFARDKHSSLLRKSVNNGRKKFYKMIRKKVL
jgi:hypothetical protein